MRAPPLSPLSRAAAGALLVAALSAHGFTPATAASDAVAAPQSNPAHRDSIGTGELLFSLPAMTGILEGIAFRGTTGDYFFGDVRLRCVWVRRPQGVVDRFSAPAAGLLGVFGLAVDESRGCLWAATSAVKEMEGYRPADQGRAALVQISLADGRILRTAALPANSRAHLVGDLAVDADGTVYATDSVAPVIWRLAPTDAQPEPWIKSDIFKSLQGVVLLPDSKTMLVSDYVTGLWLIDLGTRMISPLAPPPSATLAGVDGLAATPDGAVIGVQNGIEPRRVIRFWIDRVGKAVTRVEILAQGSPAMADPTLGTIVGDRFVFVGTAGWDRFAPGGSLDPSAPRPVPIVAARLSAPARN